MPRTSDAKSKAIATAERLFRSQGYAATGLAQIIEESGAPKGSFYFHFPGGKDELGAAAVRSFGVRGLAVIRAIAASSGENAMSFVERISQAFAAEMRASDYVLGCLLQTLASERAPHDEVLSREIDAALGSWVGATTDYFEQCGVNEPERAATALIAALEGARTLARVFRSTAPFDAVAATLSKALAEN